MKICAAIPSYNPDEKLMSVVTSLHEAGFDKIIIVNDGSSSDEIFFSLPEYCTILKHCKNFGKGRAIKSAINYACNELPGEYDGIVFVDGDNQHTASDVLKCCECLSEKPDSLVLGVRDFSLPDIPARSKSGNKFTSFVFKALCGISISDTQTGLRAMSLETALKFAALDGERYEYETNMLLEAHKIGIPFEEVTIRTIYIDENKTSHFNPIRDSFRIYKLILKYISSSLLSTLLDLGLFALIKYLCRNMVIEHSLLIATVGARTISSLANFLLNKSIVFSSKERAGKEAAKYYLLCAMQMLASYGGVYILNGILHFPSILAKIIVDTILFFISFHIQREWVFRQSKK